MYIIKKKDLIQGDKFYLHVFTFETSPPFMNLIRFTSAQDVQVSNYDNNLSDYFLLQILENMYYYKIVKR